MISLVQLLTEASSAPKAIFLAGPAGSGKSYISKQLIPPSFNVINIDDSYEELLKASGLGMSQKDFGPEELSQAAKLMGQAQKITREKYDELTKDLKDVVVDGYFISEKGQDGVIRSKLIAKRVFVANAQPQKAPQVEDDLPF